FGSYQPLVDKGKSIGNSPGDDNRGRMHVKISNKANEPIPVSGNFEFPSGSTFEVTQGTTPWVISGNVDIIPPDGVDVFQVEPWITSDISGTVSLPTGASTEDKQDEQIALLDAITGQLGG